MNLATALDSFLLAKEADGLSANTIKWYRSELTGFVREIQTQQIEQITTNELRVYIVEMRNRKTRYVGASQRPEIAGGLSYASIAGHVRALHAFFAWCAAEYDTPNPMRNIKRPRQPQPEPKAASMTDFVKLFNATLDSTAGVRDRALLAFLADTGCRLGGLLSLTLETLDVWHRRAHIVEKGNKWRIVYFTHFTAQLLSLWLVERQARGNAVWVSMNDGEPLTASGVAQMLKRLKRRARVSGRVNPHAFRHNFARCYIENKGDISTLAKILGHNNISTTAAYYAIFTEDELAEMHLEHGPMNNIDLHDLFK